MIGGYPATEFSSVDELCSLIARSTRHWDTRWYRGAKTPQHTLIPKLFRDSSVTKREGYIAVEFRRRARSQLSSIHTPFEWLCAMQHFGLPTRLLDWSESLCVALYFTVRPLGVDLVAPTIWVLDPFELTKLASPDEGPIIPIATNERILANADLAFGDLQGVLDGKRTKYPLPIAPDFLFGRLAAQNGAFTIHGIDGRSIDEMLPIEARSWLLKFVARRDAVDRVYDSIDLLKPSSDSIFPDLEGMRDYIV